MNLEYNRLISLALPPKTSCFLWGPRKVGKTTYLRQNFPDSLRYDLLESDTYFRLLKNPERLREEITALDPSRLQRPIIIDEVQKVPALLDEVHWLIENKGVSFILCGSSARKLKRGQANLLGGRAWRYQLFPLVTKEIPDFNLLRALKNGLIPSHYLSLRPQKSLEAYVADYLREEIKEEALVRDLRSFSKFLECVAISHGQILNYTQVASDVGIDAKTVKSYYEILVDTLLGYFLEPYPQRKLSRKDLQSKPKFYLFDSGVVSHLRKVELTELVGAEGGLLFEGFILHELKSYLSYAEKPQEIFYAKNYSGREVDFISEDGKLMIETTIAERIRKTDISGLIHFAPDFKSSRKIVVCQEKIRRVTEKDGIAVEIFPWREFLEHLWDGKIL